MIAHDRIRLMIPPPPLIQIKSLCKSYIQKEEKLAALHELSLDVPEGCICGIIGPSGAGKSTLVRCLSRLTTPTSGEIWIRGKPLPLIPMQAYYQSIGMIFQHFNLMNGKTAAENIAHPLLIAKHTKKAVEARVHELLEFVGLSSKKNAYPAQLSGGEKQRVGVARALAKDPYILFCDEATSALDPKATAEILALLKSIKNTTIVLITHDMNVVRSICHRVAVMEAGSIVEEGAVEDIFFNPGHPTTQRLLQSTTHEIPSEFFKQPSPNRKMLRLRFKGKAAGEPIITQLIQRFQIEANILLGFVDRLQSVVIGTLIIELTGSPSQIQSGLRFLQEKEVHFEVLEHGE